MILLAFMHKYHMEVEAMFHEAIGQHFPDIDPATEKGMAEIVNNSDYRYFAGEGQYDFYLYGQLIMSIIGDGTGGRKYVIHDPLEMINLSTN